MIEWNNFLHFLTIAFATCINSISVGLGEGYSGVAALEAMDRQPSARDEIFKAAILGMAFIETAAIMGVSVAIILLFGTKGTPSLYTGIAEIGIAFSICLPGFFIGLASSLPTQQACMSIARQPFFSQKITRLMLITTSLIQTPVVFGFIIAMAIRSQAADVQTVYEGLRLVASGIAIGLGSIGPAIGMARFARAALHSLSINRNAYPQILSFSFISQAMIETPIIFALVVSMILLLSTTNSSQPLLKSIAFLSASLCIGLGTIGTGIASGNTAASASIAIAKNTEQHPILSKTSMFAQGLIDTCAIYALLIAIALILVV